MNLVEIKEKYKQILEQPESEHSEDEWELVYSRMKNKRRRHVLTESNCVNQQRKQSENDSTVLKLKQKLAQCLSNINRKDKQIAELKQMNLKYEEKMNSYEQQIMELKQALTNQEKRIIENKIAYGCMEKDYSSLSKVIESQKLDKELMKKQVEYFQDQMKEFKVKLSKKDAHIAEINASIKGYQKYKAINSKLKIDVARLKELLAETQKYHAFADQIQNKHYLGKSNKEHQCWFSEELILETEKLVKKCKIGSTIHTAKELISLIVKFVNKFSDEEKKKAEKKAKRVMSSRIKQLERKQNHSLNYMEVRGQTLKKSLLRNSLCRSIRSHIVNDSKKCTESFIYDKLEKSLVAHEFNQNRDLCVEMLGSFRKGMIELISSKKIKTKKLMKLVDWVIQGILSIFPKDRNTIDIPIQTDQIKIEQ